jgi:carotenoid cleavage dioxygenase
VFVERPGAKAEDDGWVLTFVHDGASGASELVVIDAQRFTDPPVARVLLPQRVPFGFHGAFVSSEQLASQRP